MKLLFGFLALFLLISLACSSSSTQTPKVDTPKSSLPTALPTNPPPPSATPEPLSQLQQLVTEVLGSSNRNAQRLTDFAYDSAASEIQITFTGNDNLSDELVRHGMEMDTVDILKTIQQSNTSIPYLKVFIVVTFPLVDVYGNTKEANVVLATYDRTNLDKVVWDNFLTDNVFAIANSDSLYLHPSFKP